VVPPYGVGAKLGDELDSVSGGASGIATRRQIAYESDSGPWRMILPGTFGFAWVSSVTISCL